MWGRKEHSQAHPALQAPGKVPLPVAALMHVIGACRAGSRAPAGRWGLLNSGVDLCPGPQRLSGERYCVHLRFLEV